MSFRSAPRCPGRRPRTLHRCRSKHGGARGATPRDLAPAPLGEAQQPTLIRRGLRSTQALSPAARLRLWIEGAPSILGIEVVARAIDVCESSDPLGPGDRLPLIESVKTPRSVVGIVGKMVVLVI